MSDGNALERRSGVFDRIENRLEESGSKRPFRDTVDNVLDEFPSGPLGKGGDGFVAGLVGYVAIRTGQLAVLPVPGIKQPGYGVISHGVESKGNFERHTIRIAAATKQVAMIAAEYEVAAPSNVDYLTGEVETVDDSVITERSTFNTWEFVVDVADRGQKET
jgi:hypothetical protein